MNLRQLLYIRAIAKAEFNVSRAASAMGTNQPGISKQIRLLEGELGFQIFKRQRSRLSGMTPEGELVIAFAENVAREIGNIQAISSDVRQEKPANFRIATTYTQARYVLPKIMKRFAKSHPNVVITMRHTAPDLIANMVDSGMADLGITSSEPPPMRSLLALACSSFPKVVIVPKNHALCKKKVLTLKDLAQHPLVGKEIIQAFKEKLLSPRAVVDAIGPDVIKSCVEEGLGIALMSNLTFDARRDANLQALPAGHLFEPSVTRVLLSRDRYVPRYVYDFIELFEERWTRSNVQHCMKSNAAAAQFMRASDF